MVSRRVTAGPPASELTISERSSFFTPAYQFFLRVNNDVGTEVATAEANIGFDFGIDRLGGDHIGKIFHQRFRAAAQAIDILADKAGLFHGGDIPFSLV